MNGLLLNTRDWLYIDYGFHASKGIEIVQHSLIQCPSSVSIASVVELMSGTRLPMTSWGLEMAESP